VGRAQYDVIDRVFVATAVVAIAGVLAAGASTVGDSRPKEARAVAPTTVPSVVPSTYPRPTVITTPPYTYPELETHPEAFRGLGKLAYVSDGKLWILDGTGAPPRAVADDVGPGRLRWSPDGGWVAFQTGYAGDLFVVNSTRGAPVRVPVSQMYGRWEWSPTESMLAVVDQTRGEADGSLVVFRAPDFSMSYPAPLGALWRASEITWSPNGRQLYFTAYDPTQPPRVDRVFAIDFPSCLRGCQPRELPVGLEVPANSDAGLLFAGWSADARRLLLWIDWAHSASGAMDGLDVTSVSVDGEPRVLLPATLVKPLWIAPMADTSDAVLAVGHGRIWDEHRELQRCSLATGGCVKVSVSDGPAIDPAVSPDGRRLAYVASDPLVFADPTSVPPASAVRWSLSRRLVVANLDGTGARVLADHGVVAPRWAPDNRHLVFWRAGYLWLVDADAPEPVAIAGHVPVRANEFNDAAFEQFPYVMPGDDVWEAADWLR